MFFIEQCGHIVLLRGLLICYSVEQCVHISQLCCVFMCYSVEQCVYIAQLVFCAYDILLSNVSILLS